MDEEKKGKRRMASEWFIQRSGGTEGPYSSQQLRQMATSGQLSPDDLIRKSGMKNWAAAGAAKGLFPTSGNTPAPAPPSAITSATAETEAEGDKPSSFKAGRIALLIGVMLTAYFFRDSLPTRKRRARQTIPAATNQQDHLEGTAPRVVAEKPPESNEPQKPPSLATGRVPATTFLTWLREKRIVRFDTPPEGSSAEGTNFAVLAPKSGASCRLHIGSFTHGYGDSVAVIVLEDDVSKEIYGVIAGIPFSINGKSDIGPLNEFVWHVLPECEVRHVIRDNSLAITSGQTATKQFGEASVSVIYSGREMRATISVNQ